ncbi:unnamed protein product [Lasius platythorax]|uniref:MADF domain-containing protein n=1 Tax=Lasius platythorax TaxID=488582 RepID=A0AAV2P3Y2_9HYME
MQQDHVYSPTNTLLLDDNETLLRDNEEADITSNNQTGDALLIDLVKSYPHIYSKSSSNYKDLLMKENSWKEIAEVMNWTPIECQNRWLRLRERFSKERREIETESRSGSGVSHRKGFVLYENMKFLNNHVQRRRTFTNINNKENIPSPRVSSKSNVNVTICSPTVSTIETSSISSNLNTKFSPISSSLNTKFANIIESKRDRELLAETNVDEQPELSISSFETHRSETCLSECFDLKRPTSITPSIAEQSNKQYTAKKRPRPKSNSDDIENSFLLLSAEIKEKLQNSDIKPMEKKDEKDVEDKFSELITAELRKLPETERQEKKKKIIGILWS